MGNAEFHAGMLLQQSPACHWILDRSYSFVCIFGNSVPLFQKNPDALNGASLRDVLPEAVARAWANRVDSVFGGESLLVRERVPSGLYSVSHFPLRAASGEVLYAAGFARDVTPFIMAEQELRNTTLRVLKAQEAERGRLSQFLHDEVGQCLSSAGLQLDLLRMDLEGEMPGISSRTGEIQHVLESLMERIREFSYELNPAIVERAGLNSAMDRLVGRSRRNFAGTLRLMADSSLRFPPEVASAIYKIAQEALENAILHSGCSTIEVIIKSTRGGPTLEVRDNGKGFDSADVSGSPRGLGLLVMEHYAAQSDLHLSISSERAKGTVVRAVYEHGRSGT
ncbi:MAG: histidine kinase [Acidobacteria bacterium]|nr:histidine kinase [Acidobacteriota bacterium]